VLVIGLVVNAVVSLLFTPVIDAVTPSTSGGDLSGINTSAFAGAVIGSLVFGIIGGVLLNLYGQIWAVSASSGPFAAHGRGDPEAHVYRRSNGGWERLAGGLPEPLPSMPYALVATEARLFASLANGELWESPDRGDTWLRCEIRGPGLTRLLALDAAPRQGATRGRARPRPRP
jgi:hypothetical protein